MPIIPGTMPGGLTPGITPLSSARSGRRGGTAGDVGPSGHAGHGAGEESRKGSQAGRPPRSRSASAIGHMTMSGRPGSRVGSGFNRGTQGGPKPALSSELKEMQKRLHRHEGFRTLQETLLEQTRGGGDSPKVQDPALLADAIEKATSLKPSPALLEEVVALATRGGGTWNYSMLADSLWDDAIADRPVTQALDKGGRPKKHLFLPMGGITPPSPLSPHQLRSPIYPHQPTGA